jgi:hypothetical protein
VVASDEEDEGMVVSASVVKAEAGSDEVALELDK